MTITRRHPMKTLRRHGAGLYTVATTLTADLDLAEQLVVRAVRSDDTIDETDLRTLSAKVVRHWLDLRPERVETVPAVGTALSAAVHDLPVAQRASLALCTFGAHSYHEAGAVLGLSPGTVADLLTATLRALGTTSRHASHPL